jgi:hypothetical protein
MNGDGRRTLAFASLAEIMPEVDRLLLGHRTVSHWSLGQICNHLTGAFISSIESVPFRFPWIIRKTVGPFLFRRMLRTGWYPQGIKLPDKFAPKPGLDDRAEAEALRAAIRVFQSHPGPFSGHPIADHVDREGWERFHAIHAAHHLAFALPEPSERV